MLRQDIQMDTHFPFLCFSAGDQNWDIQRMLQQQQQQQLQQQQVQQQQQKNDYYEGIEVLQPLKFPHPRINSCHLLKKRVLVTLCGEEIERSCLIPINNTEICYAFDGSIYKESLYGSVHRGWILAMDSNGEYYQSSDSYQIVIKKYSKQKISRYSGADDPIQEFSALQYLGSGHNNVLGQVDCLEDENYYYSIMRYCPGGELYKRIMCEGPLSEEAAKGIFIQLVSGLEYLQAKEVFHRDISLENILLSHDGLTPFFIDLGMCLRQPISTLTGQPALLPAMPAKGKKSYMAPEIVAETPLNGFQADIWSLGIVLFTLLSGKFIVTHASPLCPLYRYVRAKRLKDMCKQWRLGLSSEAEDLLFRMITSKPSERLTLEGIKNHPWLHQHQPQQQNHQSQIQSHGQFQSC